MMKRDSIMEDDLAYFDPASLEVEDDWRGIFDDEDDINAVGETPSGSASPATRSTAPSVKDRAEGTNLFSTSGLTAPPPPGGPASDQKKRSSSIQSTSSLSSLRGVEELSSIRPPLDHTIARRLKTSHSPDRIDCAPPTWHSAAADMPHRQAMIQEM